MLFDARLSRIGTEALAKAVRSSRGRCRLALHPLSQSFGSWALGHDGLKYCRTLLEFGVGPRPCAQHDGVLPKTLHAMTCKWW